MLYFSRFSLLCLLIVCVSCYKEERVKPTTLPSNDVISNVVLDKFSYQTALKTDSNYNSRYPLAYILINPTFRNTGKFSYDVFYSNYYNDGIRKTLYQSGLIDVPPSLNYLASIRFNGDSILKIEQNSNYQTYNLTIQFKNERGQIIVSNSSQTTNSISLGSITSESFITDKKPDAMNFYTSFSTNSDINNNGFYQLPNKLYVSPSSFLKPQNTYFVSISYSKKREGSYLPFANTESFNGTNNSTSFYAKIARYESDTSTLERSYYYFNMYLIDTNSGDTVATDTYNNYSFETISDDTRTFSLDSFVLTDIIDNDNDSFPSSYQSKIQINSSDKTGKTYIAKILYSVYGQSSYEQLTELVLNSDAETTVLLTGGSLLTKGYYDLRIELYNFNRSLNVSTGQKLFSWGVLDKPTLQGLKFEKISEDVQP